MAEPSAAVPEDARSAILDWFAANGRSLPFRTTRDPFAILVSEVIAQQTQAARAGERWVRFMARFPTPAVLAAASPAAVLREWQGLGYNRRALALRRAAQVIVESHGGQVPDDLAALERLPGVGPYTARAVAAIAFGRPVGAVDTNVRRVLGRLTGRRGAAAQDIQALADAVVPLDRAAAWTHAVMDVGALFCRPSTPRCGPCPVRDWCRWAADPERRAPTERSGVPSAPFASTTRWLRGRIIDLLRAADGWTMVPATIGTHDGARVRHALERMAAEGLVETDADRPLRARLPIA